MPGPTHSVPGFWWILGEIWWILGNFGGFWGISGGKHQPWSLRNLPHIPSKTQGHPFCPRGDLRGGGTSIPGHSFINLFINSPFLIQDCFNPELFPRAGLNPTWANPGFGLGGSIPEPPSPRELSVMNYWELSGMNYWELSGILEHSRDLIIGKYWELTIGNSREISGFNYWEFSGILGNSQE